MSNDDSLLRAVKALRNAEHTAPERSKSTRARILMSVNAKRERRRRRWFAGIPLGILVLGGSAWAQSSGHLAEWIETLQEVSVQLVPNPSLNPLARSGKRTASKATEPSARDSNLDSTAAVAEIVAADSARLGSEPAASAASANGAEAEHVARLGAAVGSGLVKEGVPAPAVEAEPPDAFHATSGGSRDEKGVFKVNDERRDATSRGALNAAGAVVNTRSVASNRGLNRRSAALPSTASSGAVSSVVVAESAQKVKQESDPEIALFRIAHDLHFKREAPQSSIAAHRAYLARYPQGRFVPEALYNIAVDQLRSGDKAAAKRQLELFAVGKYGAYRQREAHELLKAIDGPARQ